jgi:hypothetical protein
VRHISLIVVLFFLAVLFLFISTSSLSVAQAFDPLPREGKESVTAFQPERSSGDFFDGQTGA